MDSLKQILLNDHSSLAAEGIAQSVIRGEMALQELIDCFFSGDWRLSQYASWPVSKIADSHPHLLEPYIPEMIENLRQPAHDAVVRNTVRIWQEMIIPNDLKGEIYTMCFEFLDDPKQPAAIRVFAMTVCTHIALDFEELATELSDVIQSHYDLGTAGFKNRAKKMLKKLECKFN